MSTSPSRWVGSIWRFGVDVCLRWYHGGIGDLAAGVTFWILVSLPSSVLALLAALGPLDQLVDGVGFQTGIETEVLNLVGRIFTDENGAVQLAVKELFQQSNPGLFTVSLLVALWSISRGFAGLIRALEDIYGVLNPRPWYYTRFVALLVGLGSLTVSVPLVLMEQLVWSSISGGVVKTVSRHVVVMVVMILWAATIYHFGPGSRNKWRFDLPGAIVAAFLWWGVSFGFARYVSLTSGTNQVQAAVGAGLLALSWLWMVAQALLIGGAVNFLFGERLGLRRARRSWKLNEKLNGKIGEKIGTTTDELKRIVTVDKKTVQSSEVEVERSESENSKPLMTSQDRARTTSPLPIEK